MSENDPLRVAMIMDAIEPYQDVANWNLVDITAAAGKVVDRPTEDEIGEALDALSSALHREMTEKYYPELLADDGAPPA